MSKSNQKAHDKSLLKSIKSIVKKGNAETLSKTKKAIKNGHKNQVKTAEAAVAAVAAPIY